MKKQKIYISGSVTGNSMYFADFYRAEECISIACPTAKVVNPTNLCNPYWSWFRCMAVCIWHLFGCRQIAMIDGWQSSRGARIELLIALILKMDVYSVAVRGETPRFYPYQR